MPRKTRDGKFRVISSRKASMRPRPDAAENGPPPQGAQPAVRASMRPRPDAAENMDGENDKARSLASLQ